MYERNPGTANCLNVRYIGRSDGHVAEYSHSWLYSHAAVYRFHSDEAAQFEVGGRRQEQASISVGSRGGPRVS